MIQLPHLETAYVDEEKIVGYLLNPQHPHLAGKAQFFEAMGFDVGQSELLAGALRRMVERSPVSRRVDSVHGSKYIVDGILQTPSGRCPVIRTVWIVDQRAEAPRLVTAYPI